MKSNIALKLTNIARSLSRGNKALVLAAALGVGAMTAAPVVQAQTKIGFVSTERILRDSKPAKAAQTKIEAEFKRRDEELERMANNLRSRSEEHTSELQSRENLVCRLLLEKKKQSDND